MPYWAVVGTKGVGALFATFDSEPEARAYQYGVRLGALLASRQQSKVAA
jgi:hypothetical protein